MSSIVIIKHDFNSNLASKIDESIRVQVRMSRNQISLIYVIVGKVVYQFASLSIFELEFRILGYSSVTSCAVWKDVAFTRYPNKHPCPTWSASGSFGFRYTSIHIHNQSNLNPWHDLHPVHFVFDTHLFILITETIWIRVCIRDYPCLNPNPIENMKKITISTIFVCIRSVYIPTKRRPSCRKQSPYATSCAGATASDWASLTKNRGPNRTNRELKPKEPKQRISILCSVQNSQESKFNSVQLLNSVNRETEPICSLTPQSPIDPSRRPIKSTF